MAACPPLDSRRTPHCERRLAPGVGNTITDRLSAQIAIGFVLRAGWSDSPPLQIAIGFVSRAWPSDSLPLQIAIGFVLRAQRVPRDRDERWRENECMRARMIQSGSSP
jgi:hypothetical protein